MTAQRPHGFGAHGEVLCHGYREPVIIGEHDGLDTPVQKAHHYNTVGLMVSGFATGLPALFDLVVGDPRGAATKTAIGLVVVAVLGVRASWLARTLRTDQPRPPARSLQLGVLLAAVGIAILGSVGGHLTLWAIVPGSVLSAVFILEGLPHTRFVWVASALTFGSFAATALTMSDQAWVTVIGELAFASVLVAAIVALEMSQLWYWSLVGRLNDGRRLAADLAIAKERLRFAADLHDIQGHHLQVIAVKGDLVARLAGSDPQRAADEAEEIAGIARMALAETREVVHGYREVSLALEVTNAVKILDAAGIAASVEGDPQRMPHELQPLFGCLVREGATNVLRHSRATICRFEVATDGAAATLSVRNDGVARARDLTEPGTGIAGLKERFAAQGARLDVRHGDNWFELVGSATTREG